MRAKNLPQTPHRGHGPRLQVSQHAKKLSRSPRRLVPRALAACLTDQAAQVLSVKPGVLLQQRGQCVVVLDQGFAQRLDAALARGFAQLLLAIGPEGGTRGIQLRLVAAPHQLGQESQFALARNMCADAANAVDLRTDSVRQIDPVQLRRAQRHHAGRQITHSMRFALALAAAGPLIGADCCFRIIHHDSEW